MAEPWERKEWTGEAKRKTGSAAWGATSRGGPPPRSVGWLGSDDILAS